MKATKILSTGALALSLTLGGLSIQGDAASQSSEKGDGRKTVQGAEHKCGSGNCGAGNCGAVKTDDETEKTATEKQSKEKRVKSKGASHSCGAGTCG
jgi:uncharacterized low-complexity protein